MIAVQQTGHDDPLAFSVTVDGASHAVTMSSADYRRLSGDRCAPDTCIHAAFRFLLDREPKDAIMTRFDISVIGRYFLEFERELPRYIEGLEPR
ncbi:hypothetical protein VQ042_23540 [Aurantimonas sp. A2-1-M11]|uniref:hypothetical protein n=1 Tax=Aurantimonas sp. A2-1-M11 TaxID=3113712 RepID=UPI002F935310